MCAAPGARVRVLDFWTVLAGAGDGGKPDPRGDLWQSVRKRGVYGMGPEVHASALVAEVVECGGEGVRHRVVPEKADGGMKHKMQKKITEGRAQRANNSFREKNDDALR